VAARYPKPADLFTVRDLGDWSGLQKAVFETGSSYDKALALAGTGAP
jgi:ABC-type sulfate transport system substrate-binding protein